MGLMSNSAAAAHTLAGRFVRAAAKRAWAPRAAPRRWGAGFGCGRFCSKPSMARDWSSSSVSVRASSSCPGNVAHHYGQPLHHPAHHHTSHLQHATVDEVRGLVSVL